MEERPGQAQTGEQAKKAETPPEILGFQEFAQRQRRENQHERHGVGVKVQVLIHERRRADDEPAGQQCAHPAVQSQAKTQPVKNQGKDQAKRQVQIVVDSRLWGKLLIKQTREQVKERRLAVQVPQAFE